MFLKNILFIITSIKSCVFDSFLDKLKNLELYKLLLIIQVEQREKQIKKSVLINLVIIPEPVVEHSLLIPLKYTRNSIKQSTGAELDTTGTENQRDRFSRVSKIQP